jgi:hypothetical protein
MPSFWPRSGQNYSLVAAISEATTARLLSNGEMETSMADLGGFAAEKKAESSGGKAQGLCHVSDIAGGAGRAGWREDWK